MISPKIALLINTLIAILSGLLALGSSVLADIGLPSPEKFIACGLIFLAIINPIFHAYSSSDAGPLVGDQSNK